MPVDIAAVLRGGWRTFRRDRDLLLRLAGPFLFLPAYGLALLTPAPPVAEPGVGDSAQQAMVWADALQAWAGVYGPWYGLAYAIGLFFSASVFTLYLNPGDGTVGQTLRRALGVFPRILLATLIVSIPAGLALLLWVLPGLYVLGRTMPVAPAIAGEQPLGALRGIVRGLAMGRGSGLQLTALAAITFGGGYIASMPFLALDRLVRVSGVPNPVTVALIDAGAAAVAMFAGMAQALVAVEVYRRLSSKGI